MSDSQEIMRFRYHAIFQSVDIRFFEESAGDNKKISCEANIKLPLIKKVYSVATTFSGDYKNWFYHYPIAEKETQIHFVEKNDQNYQALDPIGFFMLLDQQDWTENEVDLLVGAKTLRFSISNFDNKIKIQRKDKEQHLIVQKVNGRIEKIEIPVPLIGNLCIERV